MRRILLFLFVILLAEFSQAQKMTIVQIKTELEKFLVKVKHFERNRFQTRVFVYLDWISWVESKVYNKPMYQIIHEKYLADKRSPSTEKKKLVQTA